MKTHFLRLWLFCLICLLLVSCGEAPGGESTAVSREASSSAESAKSSMDEIVLSIDQPSDILLESRPSEESETEQPGLQVLPLEILQVDVNARRAFVYDTAIGSVFAKGDMEDRIYPASITKLYTAYVALQYVSPELVITAGDELDLVRPGSSVAYIRKGNALTAEMLVQGMLLPSGNDAAYVLAAAAGREILGDASVDARTAVETFVEAMNRHAAEDGLTGTHFVTPDGFHADEHYTTMQDLMQVAHLAMSNAVIMQYAAMASARVVYASGETNNWSNTNQLLNPDSRYYRPLAMGLKTGHTNEAGYCLLAMERRGERLILVGVFGCTYAEGRFSDTVELLESLA